MDQVENDVVLGASSYRNGIRATVFAKKDKGFGYLVGATDEAQIVRTFYLDGSPSRSSPPAHAARQAAGNADQPTDRGHDDGSAGGDPGGHPRVNRADEPEGVDGDPRRKTRRPAPRSSAESAQNPVRRAFLRITRLCGAAERLDPRPTNRLIDPHPEPDRTRKARPPLPLNRPSEQPLQLHNVNRRPRCAPTSAES
ncbi:hypothetical protein [Dactylosporangium sp. NPDC050588]|uniref:hypothetical protein n=1 Tax=Dactylosporangium sp. NPDC050588 TaxID=3157211 RepID=UPI0033FC2702